MKPSLVWIALGALIATLLISYAAAHVLSGDAEVRISARRLDDGRTEFALQQRIDGEWGERILPSSSFLPSSPRLDVWLDSSPLIVATAPTEADRSLTEQLAAAQAELEQLKQTLAEVQSRMGVDVDELFAKLAAAEAEATRANEALESATPPIVRDLGQQRYDDNRITTEVSVNDYTQSGVEVLDTTVRVLEDGNHKFGDTPVEMVMVCINGQSSYWLGPVLLKPYGEWRGNERYDLTYTLAGDLGEHGDIATGAIDAPAYDPALISGFRDSPGWLTNLPLFVVVASRAAASLEVTFTGADDEQVTATFSMDGVWETPVQPNIDRCGTYY